MGANTSKIPAATVEAIDEKHHDSFTMLTDDLASLNTRKSTPKSANGSLTLSNIASWESSISHDPKLQLGRTILQHTDIRAALQSRNAHVADVHVFNTEIDFKTGTVTNQKSSGRCWLFATTNVLRYEIMKKLKLKEFQLSQVRYLADYIEALLTTRTRAVIFVLL